MLDGNLKEHILFVGTADRKWRYYMRKIKAATCRRGPTLTTQDVFCHISFLYLVTQRQTVFIVLYPSYLWDVSVHCVTYQDPSPSVLQASPFFSDFPSFLPSHPSPLHPLSLLVPTNLHVLAIFHHLLLSLFCPPLLLSPWLCSQSFLCFLCRPSLSPCTPLFVVSLLCFFNKVELIRFGRLLLPNTKRRNGKRRINKLRFPESISI